MTRIAVAVERAPKRVFAWAVDWPGWARAGKDEGLALEALAAYADRYAKVATRARVEFPATGSLDLDVVDEATGGAGTEFGVPSAITDQDRRPTTATDGERLAAIVEAAWAIFVTTAKAAPESLRKGPRGGGRDTSKVIEHVRDADFAYAHEMAVPVELRAKGATIETARAAMLDILREPTDGGPLGGRKWTARYAARRVAWHALDHAWEIEDRSSPEPPG